MQRTKKEKYLQRLNKMSMRVRHNGIDCRVIDLASADSEQRSKYGATLQCLRCGGHNGCRGDDDEVRF